MTPRSKTDMKRALLPAALILAGSMSPSLAAERGPKLAPSEIVAAAGAQAWRDIPVEDLLVMTIAGGRTIVIQLNPIFSRTHIGNMRTLALAHWWDGTSIYRVQDNYVAQWGDRTEKKPLPDAVIQKTAEDYTIPARGHKIVRMPSRDAYAKVTGFLDGWPVAGDGKALWLTHCYGMVGVGRNLSPDAGTGAELYAVIGHAPRHLDRNIVVAGRVIDGMDALSSLTRGTEGLGMYSASQAPTPILSVRLASELPAARQPHFEMMDTSGKDFAAYAKARANREDDFFNIPAGGADICNVSVPIRRKVE